LVRWVHTVIERGNRVYFEVEMKRKVVSLSPANVKREEENAWLEGRTMALPKWEVGTENSLESSRWPPIKFSDDGRRKQGEELLVM